METLLEYKCPACGGALSFDAGVQQLKCPYCDTEFDVAALQELDAVLEQEPAQMDWDAAPQTRWSEGEQAHLVSYICNSCGGEITCDDTTAATSCPYCDNPVVMSEKLAGSLRPELVVPFALDKKAATTALEAYLKGKVLLPKSFLSRNRIERIQGVYVPFWLFDAQARADMRYHATRIHCWSDSNYNYTRTSHFSLVRAGKLDFANVPVDGSSKMPDELMESLEPFDLTKAVDFQTAYLAGYLADKFDVDADTCKQRANDRIRATTESTFAQTTAGYATVVPQRSDIRLQEGVARYALLPVWLLSTRYDNKVYTFAMNGQTGKMIGNLPIHTGKFFGMLAGIWLAAGSFFSLIAWLMGML